MTDSTWHDMPDPCPFADLLGPIAERELAGRHRYGLLMARKHANSGGIVHGGVLTALIDEVAGSTVRQVRGGRHVTVQLGTVFLRSVAVGDFVEPECDVVRATRSMTFIEAKLRVGSDIVATASLIFKVLHAAAEPGRDAHR